MGIYDRSLLFTVVRLGVGRLKALRTILFSLLLKRGRSEEASFRRALISFKGYPSYGITC